MTEQQPIDIPIGIANDMIDHAKREHPRECCGILVTVGGKYNAVVPMQNAIESIDGYAFDMDEYQHVLRTIVKNKWDVGGFFHSHPNGDARPSRADIAHCTEPDVPVFIVSLLSVPPTIRAWRIIKVNWTDAKGAVAEIPMNLLVRA